MKQEINSPEEYAQLLVDTLMESGAEDEVMPPELIKYWCEYVYEAAIKSYNDYLIGKRETFLLDEEEMEKAYDRAGMSYTEDLLNGLLDKDMIQASINKEGSVVYSLTEQGKKHTL
jgi:hypothetical protein